MVIRLLGSRNSTAKADSLSIQNLSKNPKVVASVHELAQPEGRPINTRKHTRCRYSRTQSMSCLPRICPTGPPLPKRDNKPSDSTASHLANSDKVRAQVDELVSASATKAGVTIDRIVQELAKIAFSDIHVASRRRWGGPQRHGAQAGLHAVRDRPLARRVGPLVVANVGANSSPVN